MVTWARSKVSPAVVVYSLSAGVGALSAVVAVGALRRLYDGDRPKIHVPSAEMPGNEIDTATE